MQSTDVDRFRVVDADPQVLEPYDLWTARRSVQKYAVWQADDRVA